jgi:cell division protein FtsI (penicillin-binding protein 3)
VSGAAKAWRHGVLVGAFALAATALVARMVYLHVTEQAFLKRQGDARSLRLETLPAYRGIIFDRNGEPLAVSTPVLSAWIDPTRKTLSSAEIIRIAHITEQDADELAARLSKARGRAFVYLKRRIAPEQAARIEALGIEGVNFDREYRRYYPTGETSAHVVGITNVDDRGQEGAELAYDTELSGSDGKKRVLKDRLGNPIKDVEHITAPRFGRDLHLSLDLRLQFFAYRELKSAIEHNGARSGSVVLLDARSGEILALANQPSFNPNDLSHLAGEAMRNRAITDVYEPGSTVKPLTMLAALESGQFSSDSLVDTSPGYLRVGRKLIEDPHNRGVISLQDVLAKSSQVGIAKIALALDNDAVYRAFTRAGFGDIAGSGLPGEVSGALPGELKNPIVRTTLAYGYGLAVTPLQLASSYLVLATGGVRLPVSIVQREHAPSGERVFDAKLVRDVLHMMEGVALPGGTATKARVAGYRIAGKTGTARKVGAGGYDDARHVAFFAGMAPVDDPRLVMVVVVNEPRSALTGGGDVAAPVFSRVMARALRVLNVAPEVAS